MNSSSENTPEESADNQTEQFSSQFSFDIHEANVYPGSIRILTSAEVFHICSKVFLTVNNLYFFFYYFRSWRFHLNKLRSRWKFLQLFAISDFCSSFSQRQFIAASICSSLNRSSHHDCLNHRLCRVRKHPIEKTENLAESSYHRAKNSISYQRIFTGDFSWNVSARIHTVESHQSTEKDATTRTRCSAVQVVVGCHTLCWKLEWVINLWRYFISIFTNNFSIMNF